MKTLNISALAAFAALSLAACDGDGGTGVAGLREGQFEGVVSGVVDARLVGDAVSGSSEPGFHDVIVLTDYAQDLEVTLFHSTDEFYEGRVNIEDALNINSDVIAYVQDLRTGEYFDSLNGTLDLVDVRSGGIEGSARFTAESEDFAGEYVTVDVVFNADYSGSINYNLSPSFSRAQKN